MEWIEAARRVIARLAARHPDGDGSSVVDCGSPERRAEFWRRLDGYASAAMGSGGEYGVAVNRFEIRRWRLRLTVERERGAVIVKIDEAPIAPHLVVAIELERRGPDGAERTTHLQAPVFWDRRTDEFILHADHGPIREDEILSFLGRMATALAERG